MAPQMSWYQGVLCAFWESTVNFQSEKANFLYLWSLPCWLFIFSAVVIVMMKGSMTVAV